MFAQTLVQHRAAHMDGRVGVGGFEPAGEPGNRGEGNGIGIHRGGRAAALQHFDVRRRLHHQCRVHFIAPVKNPANADAPRADGRAAQTGQVFIRFPGQVQPEAVRGGLQFQLPALRADIHLKHAPLDLHPAVHVRKRGQFSRAPRHRLGRRARAQHLHLIRGNERAILTADRGARHRNTIARLNRNAATPQNKQDAIPAILHPQISPRRNADGDCGLQLDMRPMFQFRRGQGAHLADIGQHHRVRFPGGKNDAAKSNYCRRRAPRGNFSPQ